MRLYAKQKRGPAHKSGCSLGVSKPFDVDPGLYQYDLRLHVTPVNYKTENPYTLFYFDLTFDEAVALSVSLTRRIDELIAQRS